MIAPAGVVAVVLGAGASTRFGGRKLLAPFRGRPLLQSVLDTVAGVGFGDVVVVLGHGADEIERAIQWHGERIVRNAAPERGLSSSLRVGVEAAGPDTEGALILLGDQPLVRAKVIWRLLEAFEATLKPVVVPRYADGVRGNPVLVGRAAFDLADEATGDRGLAPVLERHPELVVEVDVGSQNPDVDTPADLAELEMVLEPREEGRMDEASRARLEAAWIGAPPRHDAPIHLAPYDPAWPELFQREATRIGIALGERAVLLEHVGSTSVPGLSAKPVIDVLLAVADSSDEAAYIPALEGAGYRLVIREPEWHEHRMLKRPDIRVQVHVFTAGSPEIRRMLAFRDRLREYPDERALYESKKRELAARTWDYVQGYADAKSEVVEAIVTRALEAAHAQE